MKKTLQIGVTFLSALLLSKSAIAQVMTQTLSYTGSLQTYTVPSCVSSISITAYGAEGALGGGAPSGALGGSAGLGGMVQGTYTVAAGTVFNVYIGGVASGTIGGFNGGGNAGINAGGGGGATDIRVGSISLGSRILVAGGGGGGGGASCPSSTIAGGNGGNSGSNGFNGTNSIGGGGGFGGSGNIKGAAGIGCSFASGTAGINGISGVGGNGGNGFSLCGSVANNYNSGGGGGGGYIGGGGGGGGTAGTTSCTLNDAGAGGGGAGGSNYFNSAFTNTAVTNGVRSGNGLVILSYSIDPTPTITVNSGTICSGNSYTITPTGATSYTYQGGSSVVNPTASNAYTVIGSTNGCVSNVVTSSITVNASPTISVNSGAICAGQSFTMIPSGASSYTYSNGTDVVSPTTNTSYSVVGTSLSGCVSSNTAISNVVVNSLPTINTNVSNALCNGGSGSATVTATGGTSPYIYLASNGATVSTQSGLMAGAYTYTVTDANNCAKTQTLSITEPSAIVTTSAVTNALCYGGSGSATVTATGGVSPYTYLASNGATVSVQSGLMAGSYTYTVTDANACQKTQALAITEPSAINLSVSANNKTICANASSTLTANATGGTGTITYTWVSGPTTNVTSVTPTSTSIYTVDVTDGNNCTASSTVEVIVNALPTVSVNSGSICAGQSFTIVPSGAATYTYSNGTDVVTPSTNDSYTVTGTDLNGCVSQTGAVSTVTVNELPVLVAVTNNTLLCVSQTATLSVSGATTYTWNTNANTTNIVVSPTIQTTYTVIGTDANGCTNSATITQDVSLCTGIESLSNDATIKLYPNPNNGVFVIELIATSNVTVTNALGQVIIEKTFESGKHSLDINNETTGVYFVKVSENDKQQIIKVIKE